MNIAYKINDGYGKLLLVGGVTLFVFHFVYNVGMILGILPRVSISLPFISYGLIPTLFHAFIMGIVLSVYRRKDIPFRMRKHLDDYQGVFIISSKLSESAPSIKGLTSPTL